MLLKNLAEEINSPKQNKLIDIFSPDIETRQKLNQNNKMSKESLKILDNFSSPKSGKEMSMENDNEFYSPYVKRTISNVIKHSVTVKVNNNANNYLTAYKKIFLKNFTRHPQILLNLKN